MAKIDKAAYRQRLERISNLFSDIVTHAADQARQRCPYRNRRDECTAAFRCGNQQPPAADGGPQQCGHDGTFDYRSAWEADPEAHDQAKARISRLKQDSRRRREG